MERKETFPRIGFDGVLPVALQRTINDVDSEAIAYLGREKDVKLLERYLASGDHRTAEYLAKQMIEYQCQYRQEQNAGLPTGVQELIDLVHAEAYAFEGRDSAVRRMEHYIAGGDHRTAVYQATEIIERQSNLRTRMSMGG
jgi:hypothetical protein